jgi:hypothetical protein
MRLKVSSSFKASALSAPINAPPTTLEHRRKCGDNGGRCPRGAGLPSTVSGRRLSAAAVSLCASSCVS